MIRKFIFGNPIETEAVIVKGMTQGDELPYLESCEVGDLEGFRYRMSAKDVIYGLGQNVRGINKRGWHYVSYADDNPHHHEDVQGLYGAHNFLVLDGKERFGVFVDYPGELRFDIGYTHKDELLILPAEMNLVLDIIEGDSLKLLREGCTPCGKCTDSKGPFYERRIWPCNWQKYAVNGSRY